MRLVDQSGPKATWMTGARTARYRAQRPNLPVGTVVWRGSEVYVAELVEQHGTEWVAGVVPVSDASRPVARMTFIPVRKLEWA